MDFYEVLIKRNWIRNVEIRVEDGKDGEEVWKDIEIPGYVGLYLAESTQKACEYAAEEYGYPIEGLVAMNLNQILSGDFNALKKYKENI